VAGVGGGRNWCGSRGLETKKERSAGCSGGREGDKGWEHR
jgi:hypothetical protein